MKKENVEKSRGYAIGITLISGLDENQRIEIQNSVPKNMSLNGFINGLIGSTFGFQVNDFQQLKTFLENCPKEIVEKVENYKPKKPKTKSEKLQEEIDKIVKSDMTKEEMKKALENLRD